MGANNHDTLDSYVIKRIRKISHELVGRYGFTASDREDIEQELALQFILQQYRYNPDKASPNTYAARILDSKVATIIKARKAKRHHAAHDVVSFDQDESSYYDDSRLSLHEMIGNDDFSKAFGRYRDSAEELADRKLDTCRAIRALSPKLQILAILLSRMSVTEAAEYLGVARTTIDYWRKQIGRRFEELGLRLYL